jgi:hypothetical protein
LPSVIDFFCFFFLFSLLTIKVHNYPLCLLFFNFSPHSLNFLFRPYFFYRSFVFFFSILSFNYSFLYVLFFILVLILLIFYFVSIHFIVSVLLNSSLFFVGVSNSILFVLIFDFGHFLFWLSFICLQFNPSILICIYYVFQFGPSTFDFLFFPLALFSKFL